MPSSNQRAVSNPGLCRPILRHLQGWLGGDAPAANGWDTVTLAPADHVRAGGLCVLVVDDDPVNRALAFEMFSFLGVTPLLAADGSQAVELANELRLDLILMDLQMPVLDGLAATHHIRRDEQALARPRVPVLAYTSMTPERALLGDFGLDGVLDKPCDVHALRACLLRWCPSKDRAWAST